MTAKVVVYLAMHKWVPLYRKAPGTPGATWKPLLKVSLYIKCTIKAQQPTPLELRLMATNMLLWDTIGSIMDVCTYICCMGPSVRVCRYNTLAFRQQNWGWLDGEPVSSRR